MFSGWNCQLLFNPLTAIDRDLGNRWLILSKQSINSRSF